MSDKELVELSAKAAEIDWFRHTDGGLWQRSGPIWNPLTDDGDALRLAVMLDLTVRVVNGFAGWTLIDALVKDIRIEAIESHKGDPYAATRRVIVRAAAEIGKGMK